MARDAAVNGGLSLYPDVLRPLCMAADGPDGHIDSRASHAIQPSQKAFSMNVKGLVDGSRDARNGAGSFFRH
ncbi:MAG: hypothetical protein WDN48_10665 [Pseudolabrys sp.]